MLFNFVLSFLLITAWPLLALETVPPDLTPTAYLARADALLTRGAFSEALQFYDAAVKADPQNYLSVFKRGATYLSIGKLQNALQDFDLVLGMKPDFDSALVQRGRLRLKLGDFDDALADLKQVSHPPQKDNIEHATQAKKAYAAAKKAHDSGKVDECIEQASTAIEFASSSMALRSIRADCRIKKGLALEASADLSHLANMSPLSSEPHYRIARLQFLYLNERERAIQQLAKCLHYDPDSKSCKAMFRSYKKLDKELTKAFQFREKRMWGTFEKAAALGTSEKPALLKTVKELVDEARKEEGIPETVAGKLYLDIVEGLCETSLELSHWKTDYCQTTLAHDSENIIAMIYTAKKHLSNDEFQPAIEILSKARQITGGNNQRVNEMLQKAEALLKRANSKDYYKVLGVSHTADEKEIRKAYRNKTKEFHPDKYRGDLKPDQVEKKMAEINEAYEVLSNPELRERFDNGDDPNDHSVPNGGRGSPFQQHPFGRGFSGGGGAGFGGGGARGGQQRFYKQGRAQGGGGGSFHFGGF
ncbi:hypothetical protein BZA70DRAFT_279068 [Myxozyma melibiosi]|uniref:J domain-containing protein n=1 Tax=Myxozyma melibiosi TaxID=54550 RepID=A0ABR1F5I4_9ASCO